MAEEEARELVSRPASDPSSLTTAQLHRAVEDVKELFEIRLDGEIRALTARLEAIDKATSVFSENLVRVPTSVDKAVSNLRELHETRFSGMENDLRLAREVIVTRFDGMDRALALLQAIADRFPERIDEKITSLKEVHEGQFSSIQVQFSERDVRSDKQAESSKLAVDAALQAAKEAVAEQARSAALATLKSETSQVKAIEQQGELIATTTAALRDQIEDLKSRTTRIEALAIGQASQKQEQHGSSSFIVGLVGIGLAILSALIGLSAYIRPGK